MAEQFRLITGSNYMFHFAPRPVKTYYFSIIIYSKPFYSQMDHDLDNKLNGHLSFATLNFFISSEGPLPMCSEDIPPLFI